MFYDNLGYVKPFNDAGILIDIEQNLFLLALFNSLCIDYNLRQSVNTNLSFYFLYQLPIPRLTNSDYWFRPIVERVLKLICKSEEFADLWKELMNTDWSAKTAVINEEDRNIIKAELDSIIAHLYELTEEELVYILSTFPLVSALQKQLILNHFKSLESQFAKRDTIVATITDLIQKGESLSLEFKSTLRVDIKTGKAEKLDRKSVV